MALYRASLAAVWMAAVLAAAAHGAVDDGSRGLSVPQLKGAIDLPSQLRTLKQVGKQQQRLPGVGQRQQRLPGAGQQRPRQATRPQQGAAQQGYPPVGIYGAQQGGTHYGQGAGYAGQTGGYGGAYNPQPGYYPGVYGAQGGAYGAQGGAYGAEVGPYGQAGAHAGYQGEPAERPSLLERAWQRIAEYRERPKAPFGDRLGNFARGVGSVVGVVGNVLDVAAKFKD